MNESEMCEWYIQEKRDWVKDMEPDRDQPNWEFQREVPYNFYGDRGVVDVVAHRDYRVTSGTGSYQYEIVEFKSDAAIRESSGPNDILRQFNRHRRYFWKDESHGHPVQTHKPLDISYLLLFAPTPAAVEHTFEYWDTYSSLTHQPDWLPFRYPPALRLGYCVEPDCGYSCTFRHSGNTGMDVNDPRERYRRLFGLSDCLDATLTQLGHPPE